MSSESSPPPPDKSLSISPKPEAHVSPPPSDHLSANKHQQFCLRWNNYQSNLMSVFDQLLQNESFVDVTLACDSQSIKAHKIVLSACSPYFQALFIDNPCQHPILIMRDVKWEEMKSIVDFMYKGEINVSQEQIGPLLKIAEMLKIRGLAEVNSSETTIESEPDSELHLPEPVAAKKPRIDVVKWPSKSQSPSSSSSSSHHRLISSSNSSCPTPPVRPMSHPPLITTHHQQPPLAPPPSLPPLAAVHPHQHQQPPTPLDPMGLMGLAPHVDDLEIKPGIAEMIREEERAKLLENSQAWMGTPTSSIADSYQYQLQSMWQKCWNTNQNLMHHLRFRERGPLKSWRPETMADAIFSVLKEGLSLSQAARKYDIPYPTFVLYANRVHNMLGPSMDGGTDLRPKGRGRPQRILLGVWPDEHIKGVIKTVVFRDAKELGKDDNLIPYGRHSPIYPFPDGSLPIYPPVASCPNGIPQPSPTPSLGESMSPEATAAAVAAVAHGIRQQMQMAAVAHHVDAPQNLFSLPHLQPQKSPSQRSQPPATPQPPSNPRSQHASPHDVRMQSPEDTPISSPIEMTMEPSVNLAVGVSGLTYGKPDIMFPDDLSRNCTSSNLSATSSTSTNSANIKLEPLGECRGD